MRIGNWTALLLRQTAGPVSWDDVVVGHDFGFLQPEEALAWVCTQAGDGPARQHLLSLDEAGMLHFEAALWAASAEATGKAPRPGGTRWARSQDRWRVALLKDLMDAPLTVEALAVAVEAVYEHVGYPEDMVGLWRRACPRTRQKAHVDRPALEGFLSRRERALGAGSAA